MKIKYDFEWIDEKLNEVRQEQHPDSIGAKMTDREIVDGFTYPFNIFLWFMPPIGEDEGQAIESDGKNNFCGDEENYINQLEEYKKKFIENEG